MKERMQKTLAEVKGCPQKDRTESEKDMWEYRPSCGYVKNQHRGSTIRKEHLLERIISPDNYSAYKAVQCNRGCSGIGKMSCEQMLPWLAG